MVRYNQNKSKFLLLHMEAHTRNRIAILPFNFENKNKMCVKKSASSAQTCSNMVVCYMRSKIPKKRNGLHL